LAGRRNSRPESARSPGGQTEHKPAAQARKETAPHGIGTFAQLTLQAERKRQKKAGAQMSRAERLTEEHTKFQKRQAAKKEKHRGR